MLNNKIAALMGVIESSVIADHRPDLSGVRGSLTKELDAQLQKMNATLKTELPRLNAALKRETVVEVDPNAQPVVEPRWRRSRRSRRSASRA